VLYSGWVQLLSIAWGVERPRMPPRPLAFSPRCHGARAGLHRRAGLVTGGTRSASKNGGPPGAPGTGGPGPTPRPLRAGPGRGPLRTPPPPPGFARRPGRVPGQGALSPAPPLAGLPPGRKRGMRGGSWGGLPRRPRGSYIPGVSARSPRPGGFGPFGPLEGARRAAPCPEPFTPAALGAPGDGGKASVSSCLLSTPGLPGARGVGSVPPGQDRGLFPRPGGREDARGAVGLGSPVGPARRADPGRERTPRQAPR
jgi:hypothetical protein